MFVKYDKTFRILIPEIQVPGKRVLSKEQVKLLLAGEVDIEEKIDGANVGIIRHKKGFSLQKRGSLVGQSEHEQFQYFYSWAYHHNYDKLMRIPMNYLLYAELCYAVHTIFYNKLPDYVLVFDVMYTKTGGWMTSRDRREFCKDYGFATVPLIARGYFNLTDLHKLIPKESAFGDMAEGIVVKRYRSGEYLRGKIVKPEFIKEIEESDHWMFKQVRRNECLKEKSQLIL